MKKNRFILNIIFCIFIFTSIKVNAQTTVQITTGVAGTPQYNAGPIYRSSAGSAYDASRYSYLYTANEIAAAGIVSGDLITDLGWIKDNNTTTTGGGIFRVYMKNSTETAYANATETWTNLNTGTTLVYENLNQNIPATQAPNYIMFTLNAPFIYTGGSIEISTEWDINQVGGSPSTGTFDWLWSTVSDRIYGTGNTVLSSTTTLSSTTNSISDITNRRPFLQIGYTPGVSCSGTPNAGTASASSLVCASEQFNLSISGQTIASDITYQWLSSPNATGPWTPIAGATSLNESTSQLVDTYYACEVTCTNSSLSDTSSVVFVQTTPNLAAGTYTVGVGGDYASFTAAVAALSCGIAGPVIFDALVGSGPFNEQIIIPEIINSS